MELIRISLGFEFRKFGNVGEERDEGLLLGFR